MPDFDASFFVLPQKEDSKRLLERYFDFAVPTHRFLHQPTVEAWFEELYATSGSMRRQEDAPARVAVLFMVFAQASLYPPAASSHGASASDASARYFQAAEHQLRREKGQVRLASVQARLAQCFYLLSRSRINHAWSLFGTTAHLALAIGLHRRRRPDAPPPGAGAGALDHRVETECRRRVFWCAYTLDKYLAAALGRPRALREEDIDQVLPSCVDDADLALEDPSDQTSRGSQPLMRCAVAQIKLSRILDQILRDLYPISPLSKEMRLERTDRCSRALEEWYKEQQQFLLYSRLNANLVLPIYHRQRTALELAYGHATILTHRPFLLATYKEEARENESSTARNPRCLQMEPHVQECLAAAVTICCTLDELIKTRTMFKAFWVRLLPPERALSSMACSFGSKSVEMVLTKTN